jgi:dynactin complex subunit
MSLEEKTKRFGTVKEALAVLGHGAPEIFSEYMPKILSEGLPLKEKRHYNTILLDYLRDRQGILYDCWEKQSKMTNFIKELNKQIEHVEYALKTSRPSMHAQREDWIREIAFTEGFKRCYMKYLFFSPEYMEYMQKEQAALKQIEEYLQYATSHLKLSPAEQEAWDALCERHYGPKSTWVK